MTPVFVDADGLVAYVCEDEELHEVARACIADLSREHRQLVTTNFTLAEALNLINGRLRRHDIAVALGTAVLTSRFVRLVRVSERMERRAWEIFRRHDDKSFSYTDCTSFALMEDLHIYEAVTNDEHFFQMGFRALLRE